MTAPKAPDPITEAFLIDLYRPFETGWVTLFAAHPDGQRTTRWAPVTEVEQLATDAAQLHGWNVWFGCATRRQRLDSGRRGGKDDCLELPGLWIDIDIAGPGHATTAQLPNEDQAYELIFNFPLGPTCTIHSGHGVQAWWAFQEPHPVAESNLLARWGATWARRATEAGGFHLDNVFDAARIMRLPGTTNTKPGCPPVPVFIEHDDWTHRFGLDDIEHLLDPPLEQPITHKGLPYIGPDRPGDAYNARHTTIEQILAAGFIPGRVDTEGNQHFKWPNAAGDQSATVWADGHCTIWSETAAKALGLRTQWGYDPYGLYTDIQHRGDHAAAAKHLATNGYGTPAVNLDDLIATNNKTEPTADTTPIDQALYDAVRDEYGISGPEAWRVAEQLDTRITQERATTLARRIINDTRLIREADLGTIQPVSVEALLAAERPERIPLFGELMAEGHNATIVARWKVGKSTFVDNAAIAAGSGGQFLGRFTVPKPLRVVIFNYELHDDDMADRLADYAIPASARQNIHVVNLRGRRLPLTTTKGRDIVVRILNDLGAQLWILDPFGAAYAAAGGQEENNNAEVRSFLIALDEIKRLAGCPSLLMPVHTGRRVDHEGDEQGRGATVLEDWPDVRMLLTRGKDEDRDYRFLRTEGRAWELDESRLTFDIQTKGLGLPEADLGVSRSKARSMKAAKAVAQVVAEQPGLNKRELRDALGELAGIGNNSTKDDAITIARTTRLIHVHTVKSAHRHYIGEPHEDAQPCPGGFTE